MSGAFVLWAWTRRWTNVVQPLPVMSGSMRDCRTRQAQFSSDYDDALCGIYAAGDEPEGLRLQVLERMSP